jgi:hypothetical protein
MTGEVLKERRLPDARFPVHHQDPALTRTDGPRQPLEHAAFAATARQLGCAPYRAISRRMHRSTVSPGRPGRPSPEATAVITRINYPLEAFRARWRGGPVPPGT